MVELRLDVNGKAQTLDIEARETLADVIRDRLHLTGTHIGCDHGACGACTVHVEGIPVRSCIMLAARCDGQRVVTIEGTRADPAMNVLRRHFHEKHALQCGFCTPGMLMMGAEIIRRFGQPSEAQIRSQLSGQICRCTGYAGIVAAIGAAARELAGSADEQVPPAATA